MIVLCDGYGFPSRISESMAAPAWSAGVTGAYNESNMANKMGQIVQRLRRLQFRRVPFYAACYMLLGMTVYIYFSVGKKYQSIISESDRFYFREFISLLSFS
jgi:hypothetical protein